MERKIIDDNGVLTIALVPLEKGGPGSGRYPAGSGAGGRSRGGGGGGISTQIADKLETVDSHIEDAESALENGNVSRAVSSLGDAESAVDEAVDLADKQLSDNEKTKIELIRDTMERNIDVAEQEIRSNASANNRKLVSAIQNCIDQIDMITDVLEDVVTTKE